MATVALSAGEIEYTDSGGDGPVLVMLHGVNMDATLWSRVVAELGPGYRCVCPTLPLGSHRRPVRRPELVTHRGVAAMVGELLEALDLHEVTLVLNDWGGAQFLLAEGPTERIAGAVLVACEAFDNFPPGLPGRAVATSARIPGLLWLAMQLQRYRWFRRAPGAWGWMSKHPVPDDVMDRWFRPAQQDAGVRRDLRTFALSTPSRAELAALADRLETFHRPTLVVWASEDRLMPREHGPRLARLLPRARLVEIEDSYTLVPQDQPGRLARELARFVAEDLRRAVRSEDAG
ncbi:alpha/beta fold hydrolase [Auraticoccus sp. F435]|uniref:Alpha/beta fold hydrolase n=1 Tax=Auraticoccus cholistanensis TaxID=2656650 RepID=A0A6A9USN9_9ACTN|nr:alpha/beta hydrolase [Auraticoccus cholistanensis]MVA75833.1 alpha/beta fold hydrolase [Auraticoccus cholistanensis]